MGQWRKHWKWNWNEQSINYIWNGIFFSFFGFWELRNCFGFIPVDDATIPTDTVLTMEVAPTSPRRQQACVSPGSTTWATKVETKDGRPVNQLVNNDTSAQTSSDDPCSNPTSKDPVATKDNFSVAGLKNYLVKLKVRTIVAGLVIFLIFVFFFNKKDWMYLI